MDWVAHPKNHDRRYVSSRRHGPVLAVAWAHYDSSGRSMASVAHAAIGPRMTFLGMIDSPYLQVRWEGRYRPSRSSVDPKGGEVGVDPCPSVRIRG